MYTADRLTTAFSTLPLIRRCAQICCRCTFNRQWKCMDVHGHFNGIAPSTHTHAHNVFQFPTYSKAQILRLHQRTSHQCSQPFPFLACSGSASSAAAVCSLRLTTALTLLHRKGSRAKVAMPIWAVELFSSSPPLLSSPLSENVRACRVYYVRAFRKILCWLFERANTHKETAHLWHPLALCSTASSGALFASPSSLLQFLLTLVFCIRFTSVFEWLLL